ncbi:MAG: 5'/3'-nucleotidase SurE [Candidatus Omnitrophota bacterium]
MRILLTNDDGVHSPGLMALYRVLSQEHDCVIIAPERENSAIGHAITLLHPLRARKLTNPKGITGYAISGTPADCVKIGIKALLKKKPDLIISGINRGLNVGANLIYSGTVSAAVEAAISGISAFSVSQEFSKVMDFTVGAHVTRKLLATLKKDLLKHKTLLNINVPSKKIKGIKITHQTRSLSRESFDKRVDPRGNEYYWLRGGLVGFDGDEKAVLEGYVSVTPLHFDMTDYKVLKTLKKARRWNIK